MGLIVLPSSRVLTPLRFGTATSDRVEVPASSLHEALTESTVLMLVRPTALTSGRRLYQKEVGLTDWAAELSGTGGNLDCYHGFSSGFTQRVTSDTPLAWLGRWVNFAHSIRGANDMSVYHGPLGSALRESTYGTQTNTASGNPLSGANAFIWSNRSTNNLSFQGDIAFGAIVSRGLSLAEVNEFFATGILPRGTHFASIFGANGRGQVLDLSGNGLHATLTGAIPRESVAVRWVQVERLYVPAAGGGGSVAGDADITAAAPTVTAGGTVLVAGASSPSGTLPVVIASGTVLVQGTVALAAPVPSISGTAVVSVQGDAPLTAPTPTTTATGAVLVQAAADAVAPVPVVEASGGGPALTADAAITAPSPSVAAAGQVVVSGTANPTAPTSTVQATAQAIVGATGNVTAPVPTVISAGTITIIGGANITFPLAIIDATGSVLVQGSALVSAPLPVITGSGHSGQIFEAEVIYRKMYFTRQVTRPMNFTRQITRSMEF